MSRRLFESNTAIPSAAGTNFLGLKSTSFFISFSKKQLFSPKPSPMSRPTQVSNPPTTPPTPFQFDPVPDAIEAIKRGEFVVVMDDESRENEGDVVCAASAVTTEGMAWMIKWTRCVFFHLSAWVYSLSPLEKPFELTMSGIILQIQRLHLPLTSSFSTESTPTSSLSPSFRRIPRPQGNSVPSHCRLGSWTSSRFHRYLRPRSSLHRPVARGSQQR